MYKGKPEKAPKFAISIGFAIGQIPDSVKSQFGDKEISDILAAMISKCRFLIYVFCYYGGAHKAIKGNHTFFVNDPEHIGATFDFVGTENRSFVYTMISGRMTQTQRAIAKHRCEVNIEEYILLLNWFIVNHPSYKDMTPPAQMSEPIIIGGLEENDNNVDTSENPDIENVIESTRFSFAPKNKPTPNTGIFSNEKDFIFSKQFGKNIDYTLLFKYGSIVPSHLLKIQDLFPIQFPFGRGGLDEKRNVLVSKSECLRHYAQLSLCQFMRSDFC